MQDNDSIFSTSSKSLTPIKLTSEQQKIHTILKSKETEEYPLSQWYLGSLYALENPLNPDRIAQAANSLRELIEKLPRVITMSIYQPINFKDKRSKICEEFKKDKQKYKKEWEGKTIDNHLSKTLDSIDEYLILNNQPSRKEQVKAITSIDPMFKQLDSNVQKEKQKKLYNLWQTLEGFVHHKREADMEEFKKSLRSFEQIIYDLLAPITAQDQKEIQSILNLDISDRSLDKEKRIIELIKRNGSNYAFFFEKVNDVSWIPILEKEHLFSNPTNMQIKDDKVHIPFWPPIDYLKRVANSDPKLVIEIIMSLPETDNPTTLRIITEIALSIDSIDLSLKLKPFIISYMKAESWINERLIIRILNKWAIKSNKESLQATLELLKIIVQFSPDPQDREKREKYKTKSKEELFTTTLKPHPILGWSSWDFVKILNKGVQPLAEKEPYQTACILIEATNRMIQFRTHQDDASECEDYSQIWCESLTCPSSGNLQYDEALALTLTSVCKKVYENSPPTTIAQLDSILKKHNWKLFERIRHHLYALHPNEQTKPWIQEEILKYKDYSQYRYSYEMQKMIRGACNHFGKSLLTQKEFQQIFEQILRYSKNFTEDAFKKHQFYFHRIQLQPFRVILFDKYLTYFQKLESGSEQEISDEDYKPYNSYPHIQVDLLDDGDSPKPEQKLAQMTDQKLLEYINDWEDESRDFDKGTRINIEGLAKNFQNVFEKDILTNYKRFAFWMKNYPQIERPIYVEKIIGTKQKISEDNSMDCLSKEWVNLCQWVLSQSNKQNNYNPDELFAHTFKENPSWQSSKRAISDLVESYIKNINKNPSNTPALLDILNTLCTQPDLELDQTKSMVKKFDIETNTYQRDYLVEAFNNTRSQALKHLITLGCQLKKDNLQVDVAKVTAILDQRIDSQTQYPLTLPEYTILSYCYNRIYYLDQKWAIDNKSKLFPQTDLNKWLVAFNTLIHNQSNKECFEIFRDDFIFALKYLDKIKEQYQSTTGNDNFIECLGKHLIIYYCVWGLYPLRGKDSLLGKYYHRTNRKHYHKTGEKYWAKLLDFIGFLLKNNADKFNETARQRAKDFLVWRLKSKRFQELQKFTFWLGAECLDIQWRLDQYSQILDICKNSNSDQRDHEGGYSMQIEILHKLIKTHTKQIKKIMECFAKLTDIMLRDQMVFVPEDEIRAILQVGLKSQDKEIIDHAKHALDRLLKASRSKFLDLEKP